MYISKDNRFEKYEIINKNVLKYIVIILMLFDHICSFFPFTSTPVIIVGIISRLTAPTMALSIAEGYHYTRDIDKYMKRMLIFSIISYIPYNMCRTAYINPFHLYPGSIIPKFMSASGTVFIDPNVFIPSINSTLAINESSVILTLFLGLITIYLWDKINISKYWKLAITLFILWLSAFSNWDYYLILLCLIFYFFKEDPKKMWALYTVVALLYIFTVRLFANPFHFAFTMDFQIHKIGMFLVPLFFLMYNGKSGKKSAFNKWFFYIFYPGHLLILGLIRFLV